MLDLELPQLMLAGNDYRSYLAKNKDKESQHNFTNYYDYGPSFQMMNIVKGSLKVILMCNRISIDTVEITNIYKIKDLDVIEIVSCVLEIK